MRYKWKGATTYFMKKRTGNRWIDHFNGRYLSHSKYHNRTGRRNLFSNLQGFSKRKWGHIRKGHKKIRGYRSF